MNQCYCGHPKGRHRRGRNVSVDGFKWEETIGEGKCRHCACEEYASQNESEGKEHSSKYCERMDCSREFTCACSCHAYQSEGCENCGGRGFITAPCLVCHASNPTPLEKIDFSKRTTEFTPPQECSPGCVHGHLLRCDGCNRPCHKTKIEMVGKPTIYNPDPEHIKVKTKPQEEMVEVEIAIVNQESRYKWQNLGTYPKDRLLKALKEIKE